MQTAKNKIADQINHSRQVAIDDCQAALQAPYGGKREKARKQAILEKVDAARELLLAHLEAMDADTAEQRARIGIDVNEVYNTAILIADGKIK